MKTKYPSMFGVVAALLLVASFVIPANLASPSAVEADPGICKWDTTYTPNALPGKGDIAFGSLGSDILDMAVGGDGATILFISREWTAVPPPVGLIRRNFLRATTNNGITQSTAPDAALRRDALNQQGWDTAATLPIPFREQCYQVAIAPDDPKFWAVTTDPANTLAVGAVGGPSEVWVTTDGGSSWQWTGMSVGTIVALGGNPAERIRAIDISPSYGGKRDIAIATADGIAGPANTSNIYVVKSVGFGGWQAQLRARLPGDPWIDFEDIKFSPTYAADSSLAVVFSDNAATYFNIAYRDLAQNTTNSWQITGASGAANPLLLAPSNGTEIVDPAGTPLDSPGRESLNQACIQLPSDFNGRAASLIRAYVSLDSYVGFGLAKATDVAGVGGFSFDGIFRIDNDVVYTLMNTWNNANKSIYSIAYFGTYASGKLLAGERMGFPCTATVPTWFTDSPTTCPIPCWYPALKPTTGAAGLAPCPTTQTGFGSALVGWRADGALAFAATGYLPARTTQLLLVARPWYANWLLAHVPYDESAFAISRNNGETWNQLSNIDTRVTQLVDVAPTPDCKTVYLASVNRVAGLAAVCTEFDSVWRSSSNPEVVAPLPPLPVGIYWERILTHVTAPDCSFAQVDNAILRIVPYCQDPSGQIVGWAVYDPGSVYNVQGGVAMWSPDYGDYWASVGPRNPVQDFAFESATVMYFLSPGGLVQKMPYTGTAWANTLPNVSALLPLGFHTIAAYPEGKVLVGASAATHAATYAACFSGNFNTDTPSFAPLSLAGRTWAAGNVHVAFDTNFKDNDIIFIADQNAANQGSVYRNTSSGMTRWDDTDMMSALNGATGSLAPHQRGQFGLAIAFTGADGQCALYSAHAGIAGTAAFAGENLVAVVTQPITAGLASVITVTTNVGPALIAIPAPALAAGAMVAAVPAVVATDVTAAAAVPARVGTVQFVGATTGTVYGTLDLTSGAFIDGANTIGAAVGATSSGVCRTLWPLDGMPKPGIVWDCLIAGIPAANPVAFTREPSSLKLCGCCTMDTDTTLYAIDNRAYAPAPGQNGVGMLWAFTDCVAKKGPALITEDKMLVGCDPVSGRAQEVNLCWEQLCVANAYDIEIAKSAEFTIRIIDWVIKGNPTADTWTWANWNDAFLSPAEVTSPCVYFPAGGEAWTLASAIAAWGNLECGHTYYWRVQVRECATSQVVRSPWSEVRSFTVKAGLPVTTPYYGPQLLAPNNGCLGCPISPASFSWSPFKETSKYKFVLATDAAMTQVVKEAEVTTTAFEYDGTLNYSTNYFWRIMSLEPAPSDWSATFSFMTEAAPVEAPPAKPAETPVWVWVVIAIGAILVIVTLVLIFKTRRV